MQRLSLLALLLAGTTVACAQQPVKPIPATPFSKGITAANLKKNLYIVAGADMEGRETGKPGQWKAAKFITEQFKAAGLQPGGANGQWEQPFSLFADTLKGGYVKAGGKTFQFAQDIYCNLADNRNEEISAAEVVFAGYGITTENYDNYKGLNVDGKVVLVVSGEPLDAAGKPMFPRGQQSPAFALNKVRAAGAKGAKAVLFVTEQNFAGRFGSRINRTGLKFADEITTMEFVPNNYFISPDLASAIIGRSWPELLAEYKKNSTVVPAVTGKLEALSFEKGKDEVKSSNVLGMLPGTDKKDEYVFVTAHYDHIGVTPDGLINYGADDDGSGTVSVIEIAKAFMQAKKAGKGPRRTIIFMTVAGEEKGLLGSSYYTNHPIYPLAQTVTDLNIDMIGRIDKEHAKDTNYVYIIGDNKLSSDLRPINEVSAKHAALKLDYTYNDPNDPNRFYYRSDHYMFAQKGIPIIFFFNGVHPDYHKPTDTPDKISYALLEKRARLVFFTAWEVANRNDRLKVDRNEK